VHLSAVTVTLTSGHKGQIINNIQVGDYPPVIFSKKKRTKHTRCGSDSICNSVRVKREVEGNRRGSNNVWSRINMERWGKCSAEDGSAPRRMEQKRKLHCNSESYDLQSLFACKPDGRCCWNFPHITFTNSRALQILWLVLLPAALPHFTSLKDKRGTVQLWVKFTSTKHDHKVSQ